MEQPRRIRRVSASRPTLEGAGVRLRRAFGFGDTSLTDPFLLLDDFRGEHPRDYLKGFPWHPHRGIETITYMLEGTVEHGDSMGNRGAIGAGDAQWMTAGSGIIHQEMPKPGKGGRMGGFQLWANLPAAHKMMDPRYRDITRADIPVVEGPQGVSIGVLCGQVQGTRGPVRDVVIEPEYLEVRLPPGARFVHPTPAGHTVFAYLFEGRALFCDQQNPFSYEAEGAGYFDLERSPWVGSEHLVLLGDGDHLVVSTEEQGARFLLVSGRPLREPVAWYGPIVMNTQEELRAAFEEYQNGTFIRKGGAAG
jgi:redox-sensitive bicupin YhaK (pirin superfamily)